MGKLFIHIVSANVRFDAHPLLRWHLRAGFKAGWRQSIVLNFYIYSIMTNISNARLIVAPKAATYSPKSECNWVCYYDDPGDIHTYEPTKCDNYCEDCIKSIVQKFTADESAERPNGFIEFCFDTESSKENEGFCLCDNCGEHISVSIIWTEQELEHWLSLDADEWAMSLGDNSCCYELAAILDDCYGSSESFPDETAKIADAVLLYSSRC